VTDPTPERAEERAELIAGAVRGDLDPDERRRLDRLRAAEPGIDDEIARLRSTADRLGALPGWQEPEPSPRLRDRVLAASADTADTDDAVPFEASGAARDRRSARRPVRGGALLALAAAACVLVGAGGALGLQELGSAPPSGPPGTLGAVEAVDFSDADGARVDGSLVAHTWGTETVLEIDGLPAGERYSVVLLAESGDAVDSGSFVGSEVEIDCRVNAAVLREEVASVEIRDAAGEVVSEASVPRV